MMPRKRQWSFSPNERRLLSLLPKDGGRVSSVDLIDRIYAGREKPHNARVSVGDLIRRTRRKMESHGGAHRLGRSLRRGPRPVFVWLKMARRYQNYRPPEFPWESIGEQDERVETMATD